MGLIHAVFTGLKFLFGLGALLTLIGIGLLLVWFCLRFVAQRLLAGQPPERHALARKLFLEQ